MAIDFLNLEKISAAYLPFTDKFQESTFCLVIGDWHLRANLQKNGILPVITPCCSEGLKKCSTAAFKFEVRGFESRQKTG